MRSLPGHRGTHIDVTLQNALTEKLRYAIVVVMSSATSDTAEDPAVAQAQRRLELLQELTEMGMQLVRALRDRVLAPEGDDPEKAADAFAKLSRAIRLTIALEGKTVRETGEIKAEIVHLRRHESITGEAIEEASPKEREHRGAVETSVAQAIFAETQDPDVAETLLDALIERLTEDDAYEALPDEPLRKTVERLCQDLCLEPDWSQWREEEDDWAPSYILARPHWSPFNRPSPRPILAQNGASPDEPFHALE
jgi:hypothetical protein